MMKCDPEIRSLALRVKALEDNPLESGVIAQAFTIVITQADMFGIIPALGNAGRGLQGICQWSAT